MHATDATSSRSIPLEEHATAAFVSNPAKGPTFAERREAALVERYGRWLAEHGQAATRNEIRLASQPRPLYTDLFNEHARELVEAKGTATRNQVRLGLGQVLDYARYVEHERLAVLLPVRPAEDLVELLTAYVSAVPFGTTCVDLQRLRASIQSSYGGRWRLSLHELLRAAWGAGRPRRPGDPDCAWFGQCGGDRA